jgi:TonB-dependent Receptor Plug Domain
MNDQNGNSTDLASLDIEQLMNVKITTASLFADKVSNAPSIVSVVTSDELRRFAGMTLGEILQRVPGLTGTSQYFTDRSMVAALGDQTKTAGGHILFLINGRPTREVQEGGIISDLLESFPVGILARIEVIKGPGSVLYGSNAFSAVVNLITRKAQGAQVSAEGLGGPNGAVASDAQMMYKRGDFNTVGAVQLHDEADWPLVYTVPPSQRNLSFAPHVPDVQDVALVDRGIGAYAEAEYKGLKLMSAFTEWQSTAFVQGTVDETRLTPSIHCKAGTIISTDIFATTSRATCPTARKRASPSSRTSTTCSITPSGSPVGDSTASTPCRTSRAAWCTSVCNSRGENTDGPKIRG